MRSGPGATRSSLDQQNRSPTTSTCPRASASTSTRSPAICTAWPLNVTMARQRLPSQTLSQSGVEIGTSGFSESTRRRPFSSCTMACTWFGNIVSTSRTTFAFCNSPFTPSGLRQLPSRNPSARQIAAQEIPHAILPRRRPGDPSTFARCPCQWILALIRFGNLFQKSSGVPGTGADLSNRSSSQLFIRASRLHVPQQSFEFPSRGEQPPRHRGFRTAERARRFSVAESVVNREHDCGTLLGVEFQQCALDFVGARVIGG